MKPFKVTHYKVRTIDRDNAPAQPFTMAMLTDLHNEAHGPGNERLLQAIRSAAPEAVLVTGDMLVAGRTCQADAAVALMGALTKQYPVYYANGNHECRLRANPETYGTAYEDYTSAVRSTGVHLLENSSEELTVQKMKLAVFGYELPDSYYRRGDHRELPVEEIKQLIGRPKKGRFNILLAHNPAYFPTYVKWGADLTLSGHVHGGMVRLPVFGGIVNPQLGLFPRYDYGSYDAHGKKMIVGAGLGSHTIRLRINNPPELVLIDFV